MPNLCVAGCSFSDYVKTDKVYGEYLAETLGMNYIHQGAGVGSNWRIWRKIYDHIKQGLITSNDLLIVQYTISERQEFYSRFRDDEEQTMSMPYREPYGDGDIVRYKMDSYKWQKFDQDRQFFKMYQDDHVDIEFAEEQFECHHTMFQHFLLSNNITTIFFKSAYRYDLDLLPEFEQISFQKRDCSDPPYNLSEADTSHMNQEGHKALSSLLFDHIKLKLPRLVK